MQTITMTDQRVATVRVKPGNDAEVTTRRATLTITLTTDTVITFADGKIVQAEAGDRLEFIFKGLSLHVERSR